MKNILVLCSRLPYPLVGGDKIRMFNNIKALSKKYSVDLLYISSEGWKNESILDLQKYCKNIYPFHFPEYRSKINTLKGLLTNSKPLQVNYYYFKEVQKWIDENKDRYDMFFCNHIRTTEYVKNIDKVKIVDFVDSIAMNYTKAVKRTTSLKWKMIYAFEQKRVLKYEIEMSKLFEKKIIISDVDKEYIIENGGNGNIETISNFVNLNYDKKDIEEEEIISFLGKMNYEPNISAVKFFSESVFPKIREAYKDLKFYIVGAYPPAVVEKIGEEPGIVVTGFVNDPYEYLLKSKLFVAPMVSGAGVQNKILEAMMLGKCVITTKIGAEGLEGVTENEIIIADSVEEMSRKIIELLKPENSLKVKEIGENAKKYIEKNLSEDVIAEKVLKYIE